MKKIFSTLKKLNVRSGFHGHNNLGCAVSNSIEAIKYGGKILDCAIRGFGAGAGNTQLEVIIALLNRLKILNKFNVREFYKMSDNFVGVLKKNKSCPAILSFCLPAWLSVYLCLSVCWSVFLAFCHPVILVSLVPYPPALCY